MSRRKEEPDFFYFAPWGEELGYIGILELYGEICFIDATTAGAFSFRIVRPYA